jgi:GNAT superfamily N-acetyltransferase
MMFDGRSEFGKRSERIPLLALDSSGSPLAAAILCRVEAEPRVLQISFFEALPNQQEAVDLLVAAAREQAKKVKAETVIAGMNGHVNYGFGFLADHYDSTPCFGSAYNPDYYHEYFSKHCASEEKLVSYTYDMAASDFVRERRILDRIFSQFTFRTGNFKDLESEIRIYTRLNNECFAGHPLYSHRTFEEDFELFKPFSALLKEEHFLVAEADGEPIGFLLWYPDFNELVRPGKGVGLGTLFKMNVLRRQIRRFKIAEIGVLPKYRGTGAIVGLIRKCFELASLHHAICESGWVFEDNADSQSVCRRWNGIPYKTYKVYLISP